MPQHLTLLQLNDLHGYLAPHHEALRTAEGLETTTMGGLARICSVFNTVRDEHAGEVIAVDCGDTFHGTYLAVNTHGEALVPMLNLLKLDGMAAHWEFAYTLDGVQSLAEQLNYPLLAVNCYHEDTGKLVFPPYRMVERGGLRVALLGLVNPSVTRTMPPKFGKGLRISMGDEELPGWIRHVRQQERADLVVVISHLGLPQDMELARRVTGIDVIASGHTHNRMHEPALVNGAIIFQSGCHGSHLGRLDLELEGGQLLAWTHRLIPVNDTIPEDQDMARLIEETLAPHRHELDEVVGHTGTLLHRYAMLSTPMDNLLLEALSSVAGTAVAFSNGWRYGAPIPPGPVTLNDLWNMVPTNPLATTVELTGAEIREMLEENLERTFSAQPFEQMGGFVKHCRGLTAYIKVENPKGQRLDRLFIEGAPADPDRTYRCAYITEQAVPVKYGRNHQALEVSAIEALRTHFASAEVVDAPDTQAIRLV